MSTTLMPIQFGQVIEGDDPKALPPGSMLYLENCAMDKSRRLIKRRGTTGLVKTLVGGGSVAAGKRLLSRGTDIVVNDGEFSMPYSNTLSAWQKVGRPPTTQITRRTLIDTTLSATFADIAVYNGTLLVTAFIGGYNSTVSTGCFVQVEDIATGAKVMQPIRVGSTCYLRLCISGTTAVIVGAGTGGQIYAAKLDLTTFAFTAPVALDATVPAGVTAFDACVATPTAGVPSLYVAYGMSSGGANRLQALKADVATLTAGFITAYALNANATAIAIDANATYCVFTVGSAGSNQHRSVVCSATNLNPIVLSTATNMSTTSGSPKGGVSIKIVDATNVLVGGCYVDTAATFQYRFYTQLFSLAALAPVAASRRVTAEGTAMSSMWTVGGRWYAALVLAPHFPSLTVNNPIPNATTAVVEIETSAASLSSVTDSPHNHVGTLENDAGWLTPRQGLVPSVAIVGTSVYIPSAYRNRDPLNFQTIPVAWNLQRVDQGGGDTHRFAVLGRGALCASGAPYWYDGANVFPYGFMHAPIVTSIAAAGTTGSLAAGVYQYVAVYEWKDANGVLHRSIPSPPINVTVSSTNAVTIKVATSSLSQRQLPPYSTNNAFAANPVLIALYRTTVGGSIYYRLTLEPEYQFLINDPQVDTVTLVDTKADADIGAGSPARPLSTMPQLYTSLGELADVPPPSLITIVGHRGRAVGIDATLRMLWFTKDQTQDPLTAPGFNEALTLPFSTDKTALGVLDEKLVVFGASSIDIVFGDGPDATGLGGWQTQRVQTDVGCIEPRSIVTSPVGVMFKSSRGIELLSRELEVTWAGDNIRDTLAAFPTITSAVLVSDVQEVRFTCTSADGATGIVLAYDYEDKLWVRRPYTDATDTGAASIPFVDAALIGGVYTLLTAAGQVYQESQVHNLDGGTAWVGRDVQLAWLNPSGTPLGWHRIKDVTILGTSVTPHVLEVSYARDFATTWEQVATYGEAIAGVTTPGPLQSARVTFTNQKVQSARVRLRDLAPAPANYGLGTGPIWEGLAFRVHTKNGPAETAAAEQK